MFDRAMNLILDLDVDKLHDEQLDNLLKIIDELEQSGNDDIDEVTKRARKSLAVIKAYGRSYARKNRISLKGRRKKIEKSVEGRKRERATDRMAAAGRTPGGRRKVIYNVIRKI